MECARGQVLIQVRLLKNRRTPRLAIASEGIDGTIPQHMIVKMSSVHAIAFLSDKILSEWSDLQASLITGKVYHSFFSSVKGKMGELSFLKETQVYNDDDA